MDLRKTDVVLKFGDEEGLQIVLYKCQPLEFDKVQLLPDLRHALSRVYTLKAEGQDDPTWLAANQLSFDWIYANLPPYYESWINKLLEKEIKRIDKLRWTHPSKRKATWNKEMSKLTTDLDNGFDLRSNNQATLDLLTLELGIEVGTDEEHLYQDNCVPAENGKCSRKVFIAGDDKVWLKETLDEEKKLERRDDLFKKRQERIAKQKAALALEKSKKKNTDLESLDLGADEDTFEKENDTEFRVHPREELSKVVQNLSGNPSVSTRATDSSKSTRSALKPVRTSYKGVDNDIVEVMVNMESQYGVEQRQVAPLLAYVMNKLAGQIWEPPTEDSEAQELEEKETTPKLRKRKNMRDLTFVLPSRKFIHRKLEDAAMMNFKYVAESIEKTKAHGGTVTSGWDDTVKSAGHRLHDVKSGRVTSVTNEVDSEGNEKRVRQSMTTGFLPSISHSGQDSAVAVRSSISQMAVLCNVQFEDMIDFVDFFMNDRAGDSDKMLDELGVPDDQRLKCNAHCILCIQNAIDKVFKDKETEIGVAKLISTDAQHCFSSPSNSIFTLGLIAFAKFLSPSHAQTIISLYKPYKQFLTEDSKAENSETSEISSF